MVLKTNSVLGKNFLRFKTNKNQQVLSLNHNKKSSPSSMSIFAYLFGEKDAHAYLVKCLI